MFFIFDGFPLFSQELSTPELKKSSALQIGAIQTGYSYNNEYIKTAGFSIQHTYCLLPGEQLGVGVGIGFTRYSKHTFMPLFLNFTFGADKRVFFDFQGGYAAGWKQYSSMYGGYSYRGGSIGAMGLGIKLNMKSDYKSYIKTSYRFQVAELKEGNSSTSKIYYNSVEICFGIMLQQ